MTRFFTRLIAASLTLLMLLAARQTSTGFGGLIENPGAIRETHARIIFTVEEYDRITVTLSPEFLADAKSFGWLIPIPGSVTGVEFAYPNFSMLNYRTRMQFRHAIGPCGRLLYASSIGSGGGDGVPSPEVARFQVFRPESIDEIFHWAVSGNYRLPDTMIPVLESYIDQSMSFVAVDAEYWEGRIARSAEMPAMKISYRQWPSSDDGSFIMPLGLSAATATEDWYADVWIFADQIYLPTNYLVRQIDYSHIRGVPQIYYHYGTVASDYAVVEEGLRRIQHAYNGRAVVPLYAGPSDTLFVETTLVDIWEDFPTLTRLRFSMSPDQMTVDPIFAPVPNAVPVELEVNLKSLIDPVDYWGCSTVQIQRPLAEHLLPNYEFVGGAHVGYPAGWVLSEIEGRENPIYVFAPEPVTIDTLRAYFDGEPTPPMLTVLNSPGQHGVRSIYVSDRDMWRAALVYEIDRIIELDPVGYRTHRTLSPDLVWDGVTRNTLYTDVLQSIGLQFSILTTEADQAVNGIVYEAMLNYAHSYPYYTGEALRHTLFLGSNIGHYYHPDLSWPIYFGFPETWRAIHDESLGTITRPADRLDDRSAPQVRVRELTEFAPPPVREGYGTAEMIDAIAAAYGVSAEDTDLLQVSLENSPGCTLDLPVVAFDSGERRGYLVLKAVYLVEVSAAAAEFAALSDTLRAIADSVRVPYGGCG